MIKDGIGARRAGYTRGCPAESEMTVLPTEDLRDAVVISERTGLALLATADERGMPHLTAAGRLEALSRERVAVSEWFCPRTIENLAVNPKVSLIVWETENDTGYQLLGRSEGVEVVAMVDGTPPPEELQEPLPQVQRRVTVRVEQVLEFKRGAHNDREVE